MSELPQIIAVGRGDAVYMAHGYLTKVPVTAIVPFVQANTRPGGTVLDVFAGSGMTGVAAAMLGRRSILVDISRLGQHIGTSYLNLVDAVELTETAEAVVKAAQARLGNVYATRCSRCQRTAELAKTICSVTVACPGCDGEVVYYDALRVAEWHKPEAACLTCGQVISLKTQRRIREVPVIDLIDCVCSTRQIDQPYSAPLHQPLARLRWPDVEITPDRQMYQASALGRHGLTSTASFFTGRNLNVLAALKEQIDAVEDEPLRRKLLFAFTAILPRASKRYQWHPKRPLNAANQNYYIAPVFYEWNVYDLFHRKVRATIGSDKFIRDTRRRNGVTGPIDSQYLVCSAHKLPIEDNSVDYVFTDPPFGSNIFYSDMNLFQEAWLGTLTDKTHEAVVDRSGLRSAERYEQLLTGALMECRRVLKDSGKLSLVFSNSSGVLWALVQRAIRNAGFTVDPAGIHLLDKGQRSVKGLASGFEKVVTMDMILTMSRTSPDAQSAFHQPSTEEIDLSVVAALKENRSESPTHVYLAVLRHALNAGWSLAELPYSLVTDAVRSSGLGVNPATGRFEGDPVQLSLDGSGRR